MLFQSAFFEANFPVQKEKKATFFCLRHHIYFPIVSKGLDDHLIQNEENFLVGLDL